MRAEHLDSYTTHSNDFLCASNYCLRRGLPVAVGCKDSLTGAVHLHGQLADFPGAPKFGDTGNRPPSSETSKKSNSSRSRFRCSARQTPVCVYRRKYVWSSGTSASESRSGRAGELEKLSSARHRRDSAKDAHSKDHGANRFDAKAHRGGNIKTEI